MNNNNFKIEKKYIYTYIKYLIALALFSFYLISCSDSLGTDPDVRISLIDDSHNGGKDTTDTTLVHRIQINHLWNFTEYFEENKKNYSFFWGNKVNEQRKQFIVDTSNSKITIWIDYEVNSTVPDDYFKFRKDRIISFRLKVDSLVLDLTKENVNYSKNSNVMAEIQIKRIKEKTILKINHNEIGFFLSVRKNPNTSNLEGIFNLDIFPFFKYDTFKFQGVFEGILPQ